LKTRRPRGAKAKGLTFQRKAEKEISKIWPEAQHGVWVSFVNGQSFHWAQFDSIVVLEDKVLVFETKLTQCLAGIEELQTLYRPLAAKLFSRPTIGIMICKNLKLDPGERLLRKPEALTEFKPGHMVWTWHHLG
jgi:hypothetical protein